jgi:hypothetical protein
MLVDGRIIVVGGFLATIWALSAAGQRWDRRSPRVSVQKVIATLVGSKDSCVIWRHLAIQIGLVFDFALYTAVLLLAGSADFGACSFISLLLMAVILWLNPKTDCGHI